LRDTSWIALPLARSGIVRARACGRLRRQCRSPSSSGTRPIRHSGSSSNLRCANHRAQRPDRGTIGGHCPAAITRCAYDGRKR